MHIYFYDIPKIICLDFRTLEMEFSNGGLRLGDRRGGVAKSKYMKLIHITICCLNGTLLLAFVLCLLAQFSQDQWMYITYSLLYNQKQSCQYYNCNFVFLVTNIFWFCRELRNYSKLNHSHDSVFVNLQNNLPDKFYLRYYPQ